MGLGKTMDHSIVRILDDEEDEASVKLHCASNTGIILGIDSNNKDKA